MEKFIISLDSGTTSCRALLINEKGKIVAIKQKEISVFYPESGFVEQDAFEIWNTQLGMLQSLKTQLGIKTEQIKAIGITNQRETIVAWDKETGLPVTRAIVWQDRRTAKYCQELRDQGKEKLIKEKTGLTLDPYFSATKLAWLLKNNQDVIKKVEQGRLLVGTVDSWLIYKLTDGKEHLTDVTNASRTALFNIRDLAWDKELLDLFGVPKEILPEVRESSSNFGFVAPALLSKRKGNPLVPIHGVIGDQQAALFGQMCFKEGDLKNTYGTGCFALINTGSELKYSKGGLLTTIAWKLKDESVQYALEGSVFVAGASLKWLRDSLRLVNSAPEIDFYALRKGETNKNLYVINGFSGLGAPYWDPNAKGAILGLELGTTREQLLAAFLEGIAYQANDLFDTMAQDINKSIKKIAVDGGITNSEYLMQFQADISNLEVELPDETETTGLGAAYLAGLGCGFWKNQAELKKLRSIKRSFIPTINSKNREELVVGFRKALKRILVNPVRDSL